MIIVSLRLELQCCVCWGAITYLYRGERLRGLRDLLFLVLLSRERALSLSPGLPLSLSRREGDVALLNPRFGLGERGRFVRCRAGERDGDRDGDGARLFWHSSARALGGGARFLSLVLFLSRRSRSDGVYRSLPRSLGLSRSLLWVLVFFSGLYLLCAGDDGGGLEISVGVYLSFPRSFSLCRSF